jgi:surface antigen
MIRTTRPTSGNKYFIRKANGGYSTCIQGKPTDSQCNVLANCVGYACGAYNEELGLGYEKYHLNCNAENFIERAIASGLSVSSKPVIGSILCWEGVGSLAGHVAIVIEVINDNCIRTAESGYGSSHPFWITTRYNNNGRWGLNANYKTRGFIINPNYPYNPTPKPEPTPKPTPGPSDKFNIGDKVVINGALYTSSNAASPAGSISNKVTNITRKNPGSAHPYNTTGDLGWMDESSIRKAEEPKPAPQPTGLQVGDRVKITGTGNGSSYGDSNTAYGIGWERQILKIWSGRPFPYQVGNSTGTTGFYKESSLQKL